MTGLTASQRTAVLAVLAAMAVTVLDAGIVNFALPALSDAFNSPPSETILVVSVYQAALLIGLLPAAHIAGRFGNRRVFVTGLGLFSGGAILCALAPSLPLLVVARFSQGLGAAAVMALGIALLREVLGSDRFAAAIAWNALTVALCSAGGPTAGASILSVAPWPVLFLAGLPLGAAAMLASRSLPNNSLSRNAIDAPSLALHAGAVILFVLGARLFVTQAMLAMGLMSLAALLLTLLVLRARQRSSPMFPVDLLGRRSFAIQASGSVCFFIGQSIGLVALPFQLQMALSGDLLAMGLVMTCWPIGVVCTSALASRMKVELDSSRQCTVGGAILAAGLVLLASLPLLGSALTYVASATLCGVGFGLFQLANNRAMFLGAPLQRAAAAGGVQGSARLTGQMTGTLVMAAIFATVSLELAPRIGLGVGAAFALIAAVITGLRKNGVGNAAPGCLARHS